MMTSARFYFAPHSESSATNIYQPSLLSDSVGLRPPPLPDKNANIHCRDNNDNGLSGSSTYSTKSAQRIPATLRTPIMDPPGYTRQPLQTLPPAIPDKPRPHITTLTKSSLRHSLAKEVIVSESMSLTQFVEKYSKDLPLQIKVLRGYCGSTSRLTISADDTYSIHFVKRVKVVHIVDVHNQQYSVPINSCIEFGVGYDRQNNRRRSDNSSADLKVAMVSDLMQLTPLPKVVCVLKSWKGDDDKSSVVENEVLIVKQVHKSKFKSKRLLKVYSVTQKMEKSLPEDCCGNFSLQPYHNRILIGDFIEHCPEPFPCTAVIYLSAGMYTNPHTSSYAQDIPEELLSKAVSMVDVVVETSLVSSAVLLEDTSRLDGFTEEDKGKFVDIPLEGGLLQIEVAVVDIQHTEKLYDDTRNIYERYNPSRVKAVRDVASNRVYSAQSLFYSAVRTGCETLGVELDEPSSIYEPLRPRLVDSKHALSTKNFDGGKRNVAMKQSSRPSSDQGVNTGPPLPAKRRGANVYSSNIGHQTLPSSFRSSHKKHDLKGSAHFEESPEVLRNSFAFPSKVDLDTKKKTDDSAIGGSETDSSYDDVDAQPLRQYCSSSSSIETGGLFSTSADVEMKLNSYDNRLGFLEAELKSSKGYHVITMSELDQIKSLVDSLSNKIKSLEEQLHMLQGSTTIAMKVAPYEVPPISNEKESSSVDANTKYLMTLSVVDVSALLEAMDLTQYTEVFAREQISGEIMTELDEDILKTELGITSKLHRIRLMKVASGQHSAFNLLSGLDPYSVA